MAENLDFQVQWAAQLPNILQELSKKEAQSLSIPSVPYTPESIGFFLKSVRDVKAERPFMQRFKNRHRCSPQQLRTQNIAQRIQRGQPFLEMSLISNGKYSIGNREDPLGSHPPRNVAQVGDSLPCHRL